LILEAKILKTNGILIIHRSKKKSEKLPKFLKIVEQKTYGISKIMFLKLV
jgi:16S rRNA (guanine966-N2)-methyltransferase